MIPRLTVLACALVAGCESYDYDPLSFRYQDGAIVAVGTIDATTLAAFEQITQAHPEAKTLVLQSIHGSVDDDANLIFSRAVREGRFDTVVPADGMVASGGTDLFLAGNQRHLEPGACVGVHSWGGPGPAATSLPRDHEEHRKYLTYYRDLQVDEEFYWFTLQAAPAEDMHWMTAAEANGFAMTTTPAQSLSSGPICMTR